MRKATAIYNAPEGDSKVVEMGGVTFVDGQAVELNTDDHAHMINKMQGNQHFDIEVGEEEAPKRKPGRPSNAEKEAAEKKAADEKAAKEAAEQGAT